MLKQDIKRALQQRTKADFISYSGVKRAMSIGDGKAQELLAGLEFYRDGRRKMYLIHDVTNRIYNKVGRF